MYGDGGYIVAPPSLHASRRVYAWENAGCPVADAPEWLLESILAGKRVMAGTGSDVDGNLIQEGTRNNTLYSVGCSLRGKGREMEEIMEELMKLNEKKCSPPLADGEVRTIAESAAKYQPNVVGASATEPLSKDSPLWWFKLDINEWNSDQEIMCMTDYQIGWYISLLVACWKTGGVLPNDPKKWVKFARAKSPKKFMQEMSSVMQAFEVTDDEEHVVHKGLRQLWEQKQVLVQAKKRGGDGKAAKPTEIPVENAA